MSAGILEIQKSVRNNAEESNYNHLMLLPDWIEIAEPLERCFECNLRLFAAGSQVTLHNINHCLSNSNRKLTTSTRSPLSIITHEFAFKIEGQCKLLACNLEKRMS